MTIWQIRHHLTKNHGHHPCKYGHFGKLSDRATLPSSTSAPFRRPRVPRNASGELFKQFIEHRNLNMDLAGNSFCVNAVLPFQDQSQAALIINSQIFDRVHLEMIPKNLIDNLVQLILRKYNHLTDTLGNLKVSVKVPHKP